MKEALFGFVTALTIGFAFYSVVSRNIIYSAFALLTSLSGVAGLYLFLSGDFLAAVQVLVYVGGVMVLFLFALMVTAGIEAPAVSNPMRRAIPAALILLPFLALAGFFISNFMDSRASGSYQPVTASIGRNLIEKHIASFEILSLLLLVALLGAIAVVRKTMMGGLGESGSVHQAADAREGGSSIDRGDRS